MDVQYRLLTETLDIRKSGSILFMSLNKTWIIIHGIITLQLGYY